MIVFSYVLLFVLARASYAQDEETGRFLIDPELSHIPQDVLNCYTDMKLWDRYKRLPSSIESLVAIIRKVELHPSVKNWTPGEFKTKTKNIFINYLCIVRCSSEIRGLCFMKLSSETLQDLPYFLNRKTQIRFSFQHL